MKWYKVSTSFVFLFSNYQTLAILSTSLDFAHNFLNVSQVEVQDFAVSGSNRKNYRLVLTNGNRFILTENDFVAENRTFFYLSRMWNQQGIQVPKLLAVNSTETCYLQEDLGNIDLLGVLQNEGYTESVFEIYAKSIMHLAQMQIQLKRQIDYTQCYDFQVFDQKVVQNDMFYFKNFFLDRLDLPYKKEALIAEITTLATHIQDLPADYFLYRDFQARNIMLKDRQPYFIDFQGGMKGFLGYDLVSLLYQAKAQLPQEWKTRLTQIYFDIFVEQEKVPRSVLEQGYKYALIVRFYQLLGAYGLRGLVERKTHFLESIQLHLQHMHILTDRGYLEEFPYLKQLNNLLTSPEIMEKVKQFKP